MVLVQVVRGGTEVLSAIKNTFYKNKAFVQDLFFSSKKVAITTFFSACLLIQSLMPEPPNMSIFGL